MSAWEVIMHKEHLGVLLKNADLYVANLGTF